MWTVHLIATLVFFRGAEGENGATNELLDIFNFRLPNAGEHGKFAAKQSCFGHYGCFDNLVLVASDSNQVIAVPPSPPEDINMTFNVLRADGAIVTFPQSIIYQGTAGLARMSLSRNKKTVFLIHGWLNDLHKSRWWWRPALDAVTKYAPDEYQIVFVDWSRGASSRYYLPAFLNSWVAARGLSLLIAQLVKSLAFDPMAIRLIGFSLGAQVAGFVGKQLKSDGLTLAWITGLDPANALYNWRPTTGHIDKGDAHYVDIVHTSSGNIFQGFSPMEPLGCDDFYPNGALGQPGCSDPPLGAFGSIFTDARPCMHDRATILATKDYDGDCQMVAYKCSSYKNFLLGKCATCGSDNEGCALMGMRYIAMGKFPPRDDCSTRQASYYLKAGDWPYCLHHYRVVVTIGAMTIPARGLLSSSILGEQFFVSSEFAPGSMYSSLVALNRTIDQVANLYIRWEPLKGVASKVFGWTAQTVRVDKVDFRYMSHIDGEARRRMSVSFCSNLVQNTIHDGLQLHMTRCPLIS